MKRQYQPKNTAETSFIKKSSGQNSKGVIQKKKLERKPEESSGGNSSRRGSDANEIHMRHKSVECVFKDICVEQNGKTILKDVSGLARNGEILAIMGPSGSGKTTLLNAIGGRSAITSGTVTLNGEKLSKQWRRKICYVLQDDIFFTDLTLKDTLEFASLLRLPESMSREQKQKQVDDITDTLDLRACQNTIIGDVLNRGLSGGEKKRANIACELLSNPSIMLLDEPTSGLDSSTAYSLIKSLKTLANENRTLVVTLHQPSSQIFYMFDKLLLLCNGQVAYFGCANQVVDYFSNLGMQIQPHYNPADFIMEQVKKGSEVTNTIITAGYKQRTEPGYPKALTYEYDIPSVVIEQTPPFERNNTKSVEHMPLNSHMWQGIHRCNDNCEPQCSHSFMWDMSPESMVQTSQVDLCVVIDPEKNMRSVYSKVETRDDDDSGRSSWSEAATNSNFSSQSELNEEKKWPTSFINQVSVLTWRSVKVSWRRILSKLNFLQTIALSIIVGVVWLQIERKEEKIDDVNGCMFFSITYWMLYSLFGAIVAVPSERDVITKERASGAYQLSSYYLARILGELPLIFILPIVFLVIAYPMIGVYSSLIFFIHLGFLLLSVFVSQSVGLFIGASCKTLPPAITASALYSLSTMLFGGYYATSLPYGLQWLRYTSIVYYALENMKIVEFVYGFPIRCAEMNSRYPSCNHANSTGFIDPLDIVGKSDSFGLVGNTAIMVLFLVFFLVLGYVALRFTTPSLKRKS